MKLSPLTTRQQDILKLLYRYRFLDRKQIQALLKHNDKKHTIAWLKDLREKQYVEWIYSTDFLEKTKPAVYYLGISGVRFLKTSGDYPIAELRKLYKESGRTEAFRMRSMVVADSCMDLDRKSSESVRYAWQTHADYASPESRYHFLLTTTSDLAVTPHVCFTKQEGSDTKTYLLEVFDQAIPQDRLKRNLKAYADYLRYGEWERQTGETKPPTVLLVCPRLTDLIYAKRRTRRLLENALNRKSIIMKFATLAELQEQGVTAEIWEEA